MTNLLSFTRAIRWVVLLFCLFTNVLPIRESHSYYSVAGLSIGSTYSVGCWKAPSVPTLSAPDQNFVVQTLESKAENIQFTWLATQSTCPDAQLEYQLRVSTAGEEQTDVFESGWLSKTTAQVPELEIGEYTWKVRARDKHGNVSAFSLFYQLQVEQLEPTVVIEQVDEHRLRLNLYDVAPYLSAEYSLIYTYQDNSSPLQGAIEGEIQIDHASSVSSNELYLGTCSEDGIVCVPHIGVTNVHVEVKLSDDQANIYFIGDDL